MNNSFVISDLKKIITAGGFEQTFTLSTPNGVTSVTIKGLEATHNINYDTDGNPINSKSTRITVYEKDIIDAGITTRNSAGDVSLKGYKIDYTDIFSRTQKKLIVDQYPDDTVGVITFYCTDRKA